MCNMQICKLLSHINVDLKFIPANFQEKQLYVASEKRDSPA
jgi:hypothetical protein